MFDEPNPKDQQGAPTPPAADPPNVAPEPVVKKEEAPVDLPIDEPAVPSGDVVKPEMQPPEAAPSSTPAPTGEVEDIFEGISEPQEAAPLEETPSMASAPKKSRSFIIGVVGVLVVVGLGVGGWYFYSTSVNNVDTNLGTQREVVDTKSLRESRTKTNTNKKVEEPVIKEEVKEEPSEPIEPTPSEPIIEEEKLVAKEPVDTDGDGLLDEDEKVLGTDPNKIDTDEDGLFDREEVQVYGTDPQDPDSDGDSYLDGEEVKNGYNPLGSGKLFDIP